MYASCPICMWSIYISYYILDESCSIYMCSIYMLHICCIHISICYIRCVYLLHVHFMWWHMNCMSHVSSKFHIDTFCIFVQYSFDVMLCDVTGWYIIHNRDLIYIHTYINIFTYLYLYVYMHLYVYIWDISHDNTSFKSRRHHDVGRLRLVGSIKL